jgi:hypothetical protein
MRKFSIFMALALILLLVFGGSSAARPPAVPSRIVWGSPDGWTPQGPEWFSVPRRDDLLGEPATHGEWRLVTDLIDGCVSEGRTSWRLVDPLDVLAVLRLEEHLGVPWEARGILVSVWCMEASMLRFGRGGGPIRGDFHRGVARAHGPAQLWPWFRAWCGLPRGGADDLLGGLTCYWSRVVDRHHYRDAARCPEPWAVAEALAANGPRYLPMGCRAASSHWRVLTAWRAP